MDGENWTGEERRRKDRRMNAFARRGLAVWIVIFTIAVGYALKHDASTQSEIRDLVADSNQRVTDLKHSKAQVSALQHTNCGLVKFILTARKARYNAYLKFKDTTDLRATEGYEELARPFLDNHNAALGTCKISKAELIPSRPLFPGSRP